MSKNLFKGKELHPSVAYELVCTARKFIQSVSSGHPGSRNNKHIARTDPAIMNLLVQNHWLASMQWTVTTDANGVKKMFRGSYPLCDGGYHRWPCLVFTIKSGVLPGSTARKLSMLIESVRNDIEGTFGILKMRFRYIKDFNRTHFFRDVNNVLSLVASSITCYWRKMAISMSILNKIQ
jgi:hypothetical protein